MAVANYVDSGGPLPKELREAFRMQRFGAPYAGGYRQWPLTWLRPVEAALNVYNIMTAVNRAIESYEGETLERWNRENSRLVSVALSIQRLRDELENGNTND